MRPSVTAPVGDAYFVPGFGVHLDGNGDRCGHPTTWAFLQQDGPNHLGSWYNVLPEYQAALITSGCVPPRLEISGDNTYAAGSNVLPQPPSHNIARFALYLNTQQQSASPSPYAADGSFTLSMWFTKAECQQNEQWVRHARIQHTPHETPHDIPHDIPHAHLS